MGKIYVLRINGFIPFYAEGIKSTLQLKKETPDGVKRSGMESGEFHNGETPAIREGLTDKVWSWEDIFDMRLSIKI